MPIKVNPCIQNVKWNILTSHEHSNVICLQMKEMFCIKLSLMLIYVYKFTTLIIFAKLSQSQAQASSDQQLAQLC